MGERKPLVDDESDLEEALNGCRALGENNGYFTACDLEALCKAGRKVGTRAAVLFMILAIALGFHLVLTLDPTDLIRKVTLPKPGKVLDDIMNGHALEVFNTTEWQEMPPPWPDLNTLTPEEKAQRSSYWMTLMGLTFLATLLLGTFVLKVPLCCCPQPEGDGLTSEQLELFTWISVVMYLIICIKVTFMGAIYRMLSNTSGLVWEAYFLVMSTGEILLLLQAVAARIIRPHAKYKMGAFASAMVSSLVPMVADPFDTLKDCIFAGLAFSSRTWVGQAIGLVSYAFVLLLHARMLTDPELQLELRASYLSVLCVPTLPAQGSGPKQEPANGSDPKQEQCATCPCTGLVDLRAMGSWALVRVYLQTRPSRLRSLLGEDLPQGALAVIFSLYLWLVEEQPTQPIVIALNIVLPFSRFVFAWCLREPLVRRAIEWIIEQHYANWAAGLEDLALEFRKEQEHVRTESKDEGFHFPSWHHCDPRAGKGQQLVKAAIRALRDKAADLNVGASALMLIQHLFHAFAESDGTEAVKAKHASERLQDLLILRLLDPAVVDKEWKGYKRPPVDPKVAGKAVRLAASFVVEWLEGELASLDKHSGAKDRLAVLQQWIPSLEMLTQVGKTEGEEVRPEVRKAVQRALNKGAESLKVIDLSGADLTEEDLKEVFFLVGLDAGLVSLKLTGNKISDVSGLQDALAQNSTIRELDLSLNPITYANTSKLVLKKRPAAQVKEL